MWRDRCKSALIGTPLQPPMEAVRWLMQLPRRWRHPEMREIWAEPRRTAQLLPRFIRRDSNCIDIGCHLGSVLQQMIRLAPAGRHVAIEPVPHMAAWLKGKFPRVAIHQVALSDRAGSASFIIDTRQSGYSHLAKDGGAAGGAVEVQLARLDDLIPPGHRVDFIKMDVEGAELGALRGAARVLDESRPVILFECTRSGLKRTGVESGDVFACLAGHRYDILLLRDALGSRRALSAAEFESAMHYPFAAFNFVALPTATPTGSDTAAGHVAATGTAAALRTEAASP